MSSGQKKPTILKSYKTLYRGRRLWAVKNDALKPIDGWTKDYTIVVWDASVDAIAAVGDFKPDGSIRGEISWGQGVSFEAVDIRDMIRMIVWLEKDYV